MACPRTGPQCQGGHWMHCDIRGNHPRTTAAGQDRRSGVTVQPQNAVSPPQ